MTNNKNILSSLDVIEIELKQDKYSSVIPTAKASMSGLFVNTKRVITEMSKFGFKLDNEVGDLLFFSYDDCSIVLNKRTRDIEDFSIKESKCYGIVVPWNDMPFVFFHDGDSFCLVTYESIEDSITSIYRSTFTLNELFVLKATNTYLFEDIYNCLSSKKSRADIAEDIPGNVGLNYIYVLFGLMGIEFPDSFADEGASKQIFETSVYGFVKV